MTSRWDAFAQREPYFAVLTHPRFLRAHFDAGAEAQFFDSGEEYAGDLYGDVLPSLAPHFSPLHVLEYGCGVGRLLIPFARRSETVVGVDISPAMLDVARVHLEKARVPNVELMTTEAFARDPRKFDLVNCFLVLQRMRRGEGMALLRELAARVREGGIGVFHVPYRDRVSPLVTIARTARARVPGVNAVANVLRHKPASTPLIETHTYDLNEVFGVLQELGFDTPHVVFTRHGDVDGVIVHVRRRHHPSAVNVEEPQERVEPADFIDVKKMIAETPAEELYATAERYFASLDNWEHHLAKPFARVEDTPQLLISLGTLIQGLSLVPGMTVLEFGAGTGWLARFLTQLGARMILLDVAPTALAIARELYARQPVIGKRPDPQFLVFDGHRIDLPDASVDRILCFDSFHHAPNPDEVLRELGRVLKPHGIAAFAEPGPHHSRSPQSQFEMRTYGVVENDIDVHAIWETAKRLGFVDIKLAAFNATPFLMSLAEYDELLAAGESYARWAECTRAFLQGARMFYLTKSGAEVLDSRSPSGLRCDIEVQIEEGVAHAIVRNTGRASWLASSEVFGGVALGCHLYDGAGHLMNFEWLRAPLPRALAPHEEVALDVMLPVLGPGSYVLEFDCVANEVAWFGQIGSNVTRVKLEKSAAPLS